MTMVPMLRGPVGVTYDHRVRAAGKLAVLAVLCFCTSRPLAAQAPSVHYRHSGASPPGAIGSWQLKRGGPLPGYFQPVEIVAPQGAQVSLAAGGQFHASPPGPVLAGMQIGGVYRIRVAGIPLHQGDEVFPTIEVIDRLYPPPGQAWRFPIQIHLTQQDLELALAGKYVTRVVYLEEPRGAPPVADNPRDQPWFDVPPSDNPLQVADQFGRPVAIVRLGGRLPLDATQPDHDFLFGCPPLLMHARPPQMPRHEVVPSPSNLPTAANNLPPLAGGLPRR